MSTLHRVLYWFGVILALACGATIFFGHTAFLSWLGDDHAALSGALAGIAILSFAAGEFVSSIHTPRRPPEPKPTATVPDKKALPVEEFHWGG